VEAAILLLNAQGFNAHISEEGHAQIHHTLPVGGEFRIPKNRMYGKRFRFGFCTDNHIGSKYARLDVLNAIYDWYVKEGITDVFNGGNLIDGLCRLNKYDLVDGAHSMEGQIKLLVRDFPKRKGIITHFLAADDHEGWWTQDVGVNIGQLMEDRARQAGREDLHYLAYLEADIKFQGPYGETWGRVMHPGGGSAYAVSYVPQKIVESFQGGEKPAILMIAHHHKMEQLLWREVFCFQGGCTQDQTPFERKNKISIFLGAWKIEFEQAPDGHVASCGGEFKRFYDRGFYEKQEKFARW